MQYLFLALALVWMVTLLYVVFLLTKQRQLEALVEDLRHQQSDPNPEEE